MIYVVMGVMGSGKSTTGRMLADRLRCPFREGDDYHPESNREKMRAGIPLTDEDRWPWLQALRDVIERELSHSTNAVLTCSALKQAYRDILSEGRHDVYFIFLDGRQTLIRARVRKRQSHNAAPSLLKSQYKILEIPRNALRIDIDQPPVRVVDSIIDKITGFR